MSKYHVGKAGIPLCRSSGTAGGYHVVVLGRKEFDVLREEAKCKKCAAKLILTHNDQHNRTPRSGGPG